MYLIFLNEKLQWQYVLACTCIYDCMHAVKWYDIYIYYSKSEVEEMKKAMEEELRKNQEEIENMKKTWQERLSEQETANKVLVHNPIFLYKFCTS